MKWDKKDLPCNGHRTDAQADTKVGGTPPCFCVPSFLEWLHHSSLLVPTCGKRFYHRASARHVPVQLFSDPGSSCVVVAKCHIVGKW